MRRRRLVALSLGVIPFVGICFSVSLWDRIYPTVLGIPFNLFWLILWTVVTPLFMWGAYRLQAPRAERRIRGKAP